MSTSTTHRKSALSLLCAGAKKLGLATVAALTLVSTSQAATDEFVYFHTDMLGSPVAAFSESGEVCWTETYAPYGEKLDKEDQFAPESGCGLLRTDVGYTGHVQDSSGLVYAQQRYYDPVIGRFMSTDPAKPNAGDPRYFGRYQYALNNPYKYTDPSGEFAFLGFFAGFFTSLTTTEAVVLTGAVVTTAAAVHSSRLGGAALSEITEGDQRDFELVTLAVLNEAVDDELKSNKKRNPRKINDDDRVDEIAENNGYEDAHDLKKAYGLDSDRDIYVDKKGNVYAGPRQKGDDSGFEDLGIKEDGS